jgi:hydrogenase maturation factor HypF (carbamoyltransferase family)
VLKNKIKVACPKCTKEFSVPANKVRAGLTVCCEFCKTAVRITPTSEDESLRKVLSAARKIRRLAATPL